MRKKAQIQTNVLIYALAGIVIVALLIFAVRSFINARDAQRTVQVAKFQEDLGASVAEIEFGSVQEGEFGIPSDVELVCLMDLSKRAELLASPVLKQFPQLWDSLNAGEEKNVFFLSGGSVKDSFFTADICFDAYPYYTCIKPTASTLDLFVEGKGTCGLILSGGPTCTTLPGSGPVSAPIAIGDGNGHLNIPNGATVTFPGTDHRLCMGPVEDNAEGRLSETYNITPKDTSVGQGTVALTYFLKQQVNPNHIKIKRYDGAQWVPLATTVDAQRKEASASISTLSKVAIFGPEPPKAVITVTEPADRASLTFSKNEAITFSHANSSDPDGDMVQFSWDFGNPDFGAENTDTTAAPGETFTRTYPKQGSYTVTLKIKDSQNNENTAKITISIINSNNKKNMALYADNPVFVAKDDELWQTLLKYIPVVMWKSLEGDKRFDYFIYHTESGANPNDFKISSLKGAHGKIIYVTAGSTLPPPFNNPDAGAELAKTPFDYWDSTASNGKGFEDIVAVKGDSEQTALMAALYAAYLNAPMVYISSSSDVAIYVTQLEGSTVHYVGQLDVALKSSMEDAGATAVIALSLNDDIKNPQKNPYSELSSQVVLTSENW